MNSRTLNALALAVVLVAAACNRSDAPPAERFRNELASLNEAAIVASTAGNDLHLSFPVQRLRSDGSLDGELRVELSDASRGAAELFGDGNAARLAQ
ncbi:MAG: hypothetical protein IPK60_25580 [Sandaracinaceae bacterium]|nr:hypothetical protein [Sandaracinaceae bacterium]